MKARKALLEAPACSGYGVPSATSMRTSRSGITWSTYIRRSPERIDSVAVSSACDDSQASSGAAMARTSMRAR